MNAQTRHAAALLRISLGLVYLSHGLLKLIVFTPAGTAGFFESLGLPYFLAHFTIWFEVLGGLALILGFKSTLVAITLLPILAGSILWVHGANGWGFSNAGGGWEYPAFLMATSLAVALLGNGAFAVESLKPLRSISPASA